MKLQAKKNFIVALFAFILFLPSPTAITFPRSSSLPAFCFYEIFSFFFFFFYDGLPSSKIGFFLFKCRRLLFVCTSKWKLPFATLRRRRRKKTTKDDATLRTKHLWWKEIAWMIKHAWIERERGGKKMYLRAEGIINIERQWVFVSTTTHLTGALLWCIFGLLFKEH